VLLGGGGAAATPTTTTGAVLQGTAPDTAPRVSIDEFKKLLGTKKAIVLDVRGDEVYKQGHIPGALSVPLDTVERRAHEWVGTHKPIVAYCS
jgi:rhodanese-related sulfurtransferase